MQDLIILHSRLFCTDCHLSVSTTHESCHTRPKQMGWLGQSKAVPGVCLQCDNNVVTWPSPPSSACVVASKGPWSSSWKNQAGFLPPLLVRCEDEKMEIKYKKYMKRKSYQVSLFSFDSVLWCFVFGTQMWRVQLGTFAISQHNASKHQINM